MLKGKTIAITGASGYIASAVLSQLKEIECTIIRISRSGSLPSIKGKAHIRDVTSTLNDEAMWSGIFPEADIVFHFAGQTSTYRAKANLVEDLSANVAPVAAMLDSARDARHVPTIIFSGTSTQVGMPSILPVNELHQDSPITVYDIHKLASEQLLMLADKEGWIQGVSLRLTNVYGPGPRSSSSDRGILNIMTRQALQGSPLTIYGEGKQIRDYIYIEDVARAFLMAAETIDSTRGSYYVLGSGVGYSISNCVDILLERIHKAGGRRVEITHIPMPENTDEIEFRDFVADTSSFRAKSGWRPAYSLEKGLDKTIALMQSEVS